MAAVISAIDAPREILTRFRPRSAGILSEKSGETRNVFTRCKQFMLKEPPIDRNDWVTFHNLTDARTRLRASFRGMGMWNKKKHHSVTSTHIFCFCLLHTYDKQYNVTRSSRYGTLENFHIHYYNCYSTYCFHISSISRVFLHSSIRESFTKKKGK